MFNIIIKYLKLNSCGMVMFVFSLKLEQFFIYFYLFLICKEFLKNLSQRKSVFTHLEALLIQFLVKLHFALFFLVFLQSLDTDKPVAPVKRSPLRQETNLANFSYRFSMYNLNGLLNYLPPKILVQGKKQFQL